MFRWFNQNDHWFRVLLFLASGFPAVLLMVDIYLEKLGFNPFEALIQRTGFWSIFFLILTLAITPVRRWMGAVCKALALKYGKRLADWNFLIKSRRMVGLYSFFYLCLHAGVYLHLELGWRVSWFYEDLMERGFLLVGLVCWGLSALLAVTSPIVIRRKLGRRWRQLHRLMYPLSLLAITHVLMEAKVGEQEGLLYGIIVMILLTHRVFVRAVKQWRREDDNGLEVER
ncbi:MAG: sulfoxide reductase heme-binding subunit YedZ [Pseudomonadales bacterium]|nr:sulfoxide reductase heme-binding subunit YedZ [Pseudomonadales bacterium]